MACRARVLLAVVLSGRAVMHIASADTESVNDDGSDPAEVKVTARRIAEDSRKVPVAVTVLSAAKVDSLALNTPLDLNKIPGLTDAPTGSRNNVSFAIRGQGTAYGGQPGVIPYFGEVPNFPLTYFDLQSVQVIKGPQGTLFGQTSTGGVLLFEPKRPTDTFEGYADLQAGDHDYSRVRAAVNIPIVEGKLFVRLAGELRNRSGWSTGLPANASRSSSDLNDLDDASVRASVTWKPLSDVEVYTLYAEDNKRTHGTSSVLYYADPRFMNASVRDVAPASVPSIAAGWKFWTGEAPPPGQTFSQLLTTALGQQLADGALTTRTDFNQASKTVNRGVINQVSWNITSDIRVRNLFGLRWQTFRGGSYDLDGTSLPLDGYECRYDPNSLNAGRACATTGGWPSRTLTEEIQLQGISFARRLQWQVGAFYLQGGVREFAENTLPLVLFGSLASDPGSRAFCASVGVAWPCASMAKTQTSSKALFGQATWALAERLHLTAGYRETWDYTRTDTSAKASYQIPFEGQLVTVPTYGGTLAPGANTLSTAVDLPANGSYNVSADWQVNDTLLLYLAHRSGYKSGGINATADPGSPHRTYGPERAKDLELGAKTEWVLGDVRATLDADVYHTRYSNVQEGQIIPGTGSTVTTNLAAARITGFEMEGAIFPSRWLRVAASVAFIAARYTSWLEYSTCAAQYWRPQCAGSPATTVIAIDHAGGNISLPGGSISFEPDRFLNTSRWQWSVQPAFLFEPWLGRDVTLSANIYHRGPYVDSVATTNTSITAGVPMTSRNTVFGYSTADPFDAPGYTVTDLRLDWHRVGGSRVSLAAAVTNLTNRIYRVSSSSAFVLTGAVYSVVGEPRMWFGQATYEF